MKSYVNKIVLLWSCCIIGFAFAVDQAGVTSNAPDVKMTSKKVEQNKPVDLTTLILNDRLEYLSARNETKKQMMLNEQAFIKSEL